MSNKSQQKQRIIIPTLTNNTRFTLFTLHIRQHTRQLIVALWRVNGGSPEREDRATETLNIITILSP